MKPTAIFASILLAGLAGAQEQRYGWYMGISYMENAKILGSSEKVVARMVNFGYARRDPKLSLFKIPSQLVIEGYYISTQSAGLSPKPVEIANGLGLLVFGRYRFGAPDRIGVYADIGWGLQYVDRLARDLDSNVNSTPYLGLGIRIPQPQGEILVGLQYLHVSNGGTAGSNRGQNFIGLALNVRF